VHQVGKGVVVITGAGSGIGRALAFECANQNMDVVVADISAEAAEIVAQAVLRLGRRCISVRTDVTDRSSVEALADRVYHEFGSVQILFNNAGVNVSGRVMDLSEANWQWMFAVNFWGVLNGVKAFVPRMLAQTGERHIVNTSSLAGVSISTNATSAYHSSKFAVTAMSAMLRGELAQEGIGVSILCPGTVATKLGEGVRFRPERFGGPQEPVATPPSSSHWAGSLREPEEVAPHILEAVWANRCFIFTHPETRIAVEEYFTRVLSDYDDAGT
jgi:NAD(P)-dependent dehydrogenase (short-subunit alcohol dehydrogenase family)